MHSNTQQDTITLFAYGNASEQLLPPHFIKEKPKKNGSTILEHRKRPLADRNCVPYMIVKAGLHDCHSRCDLLKTACTHTCTF